MWVEELQIRNIKCFDDVTIKLGKPRQPYRWVTLLGENGGGKSIALQALGLLLAGPEGAQKLLPRPVAWLRSEDEYGTLRGRIHQGDNDPGQHGTGKVTRAFGYTYFVTGSKPVSVRNRQYTEPAIVESVEKRLSWLRQNAFTSTGGGWFAVGYGAFRRLTRSSQVIVPSLEQPARFTNFSTQFDEDQPLSAFERWMVYLDYRVAKDQDHTARRQYDLGVAAINKVLPDGVRFDQVTPHGRICFITNGMSVATIALSDGYRSVLALAGDLVWRLIQAFPNSDDPLHEEGVVLIDELDIHLHPVWQRQIAQWLQEQFPGLQFIVATHSPLIAAGAGDTAQTVRFRLRDGRAEVEAVPNVSALSVDRILQSEAFGAVSPYSPATQAKIDRYDHLVVKGARRSRDEECEWTQLSLFMDEARPFGGPPEPGSLEAKIDQVLRSRLQ